MLDFLCFLVESAALSLLLLPSLPARLCLEHKEGEFIVDWSGTVRLEFRQHNLACPVNLSNAVRIPCTVSAGHKQ
jgi:hypothetical protein